MEVAVKKCFTIEAKLSPEPPTPSMRRHGDNEHWHDVGVSVASDSDKVLLVEFTLWQLKKSRVDTSQTIERLAGGVAGSDICAVVVPLLILVIKLHKIKKKSLPAKNLMAEHRRCKKLNYRIYMLRSLVPKIYKIDRESILLDAIDYLKELLQIINDLHNELESTMKISAQPNANANVDYVVSPLTNLQAVTPTTPVMSYRVKEECPSSLPSHNSACKIKINNKLLKVKRRIAIKALGHLFTTSYLSKIPSRRYSGNNLVNMWGKWKEIEYSLGGQFTPVDGLVYYIIAPASLIDMAANPFHALFYLTFILTACALFFKTWIEMSGSSARDVAKQLKRNKW